MSRFFFAEWKGETDFMMDYEIFKEVVKEGFLSYMPKSYQDMWQSRLPPR